MEALDNVGIVVAEKDDDAEKRRHTIPIYGSEFEWWTAAVRRQLEVMGIDQKELSERLGIDTGSVSRCINRKKPTFELLILISDFLKVAYPVVLPESEEEALALAKEKRLHKREAKAHKIKAGVPETAAKDQTARVPSEHAVRSRKEAATQGAEGTRRRSDRNQP